MQQGVLAARVAFFCCFISGMTASRLRIGDLGQTTLGQKTASPHHVGHDEVVLKTANGRQWWRRKEAEVTSRHVEQARATARDKCQGWQAGLSPLGAA